MHYNTSITIIIIYYTIDNVKEISGKMVQVHYASAICDQQFKWYNTVSMSTKHILYIHVHTLT
jgi:hypothetical protein